MAHLIFKLRAVPDDEADDVRHLLESNNIEYFETNAGNWGISMPGLWLNNNTDVPRAKQLIKAYQEKRSVEIRQHYQELKEAGQHTTLLGSMKERPFAKIGIVAFCGVIIYFSIKPFLALIDSH